MKNQNWAKALEEMESWKATDLIPEDDLDAACAALTEMVRREDKLKAIKEIMKP